MTERTSERNIVRDEGMRRALEGIGFIEEIAEGLDHHQLREVYLGYVDYLTERQMRMYCRADMTASQMHEVRVGFARGLPDNLVAAYALPELPWEAMRTARLILEGAFDPAEVAAARAAADMNPKQIIARAKARATKICENENERTENGTAESVE